MAHHIDIYESNVRKRDVAVALLALGIVALAGGGPFMLVVRLAIPAWVAYIVGIRRVDPNWRIASKTFLWTLIPWMLVVALAAPVLGAH